MATKEVIETGTEIALKEGAEGLSRNIFKEGGKEIASKEVFDGFSEYLTKHGGEAGKKTGEWLKKANDLADKSPKMRKYLDDYLTLINNNKKDVGDLKELSVKDIVDAMEILPVKFGGQKSGAEGASEAAETGSEETVAATPEESPAAASETTEAQTPADAVTSDFTDWTDAKMAESKETRVLPPKNFSEELRRAREKIDSMGEITPEIAEEAEKQMDAAMEKRGIDQKMDDPADAVEKEIARNLCAVGVMPWIKSITIKIGIRSLKKTGLDSWLICSIKKTV
jgi:alkylhydroperoxidase/carboxymuconolactone decarboxylase family protein YurZ